MADKLSVDAIRAAVAEARKGCILPRRLTDEEWVYELECCARFGLEPHDRDALFYIVPAGSDVVVWPDDEDQGAPHG